MSEGRYEAVIVGAGIAGLTAGWTLRDRKILVLEATDRVGGRMRSEPRGPYWLNLGPTSSAAQAPSWTGW